MKRALVITLLGATIVLGAAAVRAVWEGRAALDDGDAALRRGDAAAAIVHWRRAARWYVPLAGATADALSRLQTLAAAAETRGDTATAQSAWLAVRTATISLRGATAPFDDVRARADARLAVLLAASDNPSAGLTADARALYHTDVLATSTRPTRALFLVAALGLLLMLTGATLALTRRPLHRRPLILFAAGTGLWLVGLLLS